ncbi:MAG TPA: CAP domain-containing protein [Pyrinomonadaceae bacterium]|nr:CAP domain-containing protein [Pyrinomonadaceae bacterium]
MKSRTIFFLFNLILLFSFFSIAVQTGFSQKFSIEAGRKYFSYSGGDAKIALPTRPRIFKNEKPEAASKPETSRKTSVGGLELERRVFDLINRRRTEAGLHLLLWNDNVARVARLHSANMANFDFFSHTGIDGKKVNNRADSLGVRKWHAIGENIAYNRGFKSPLESAVQSWMNSPGHRDNLLKNDWQESGIGVAVKADGTYYFTQVFLKK